MTYLLTEACEHLGIKKEFLIHCIRAHWIKPAIPQTTELDDEDLARLELILSLKETFGVNDESIPIILHLLDQLYYFQNQVNIRLKTKI